MLSPPRRKRRLETRLFGVRRLDAALPEASLLGKRTAKVGRSGAREGGPPQNKKPQPNGWGAEDPQGRGPALTKKASSAEPERKNLPKTKAPSVTPGRTFLRDILYYTRPSLVK
jgi:hypothetical protein